MIVDSTNKTSRTKLKKLASKQKQVLRIVNNEYTDIGEII